MSNDAFAQIQPARRNYPLVFPITNNSSSIFLGVRISDANIGNEVQVGRFFVYKTINRLYERDPLIWARHLSLFQDRSEFEEISQCFLIYILYIVRLFYYFAIKLLATAACLLAIGSYFILTFGVFALCFVLPAIMIECFGCGFCCVGCLFNYCNMLCSYGFLYLAAEGIKCIHICSVRLSTVLTYCLFFGTVIALTLSYAVIMFVPASLYILYLYLNKSRISPLSRYNDAALVAELKCCVLYPLFLCFTLNLLHYNEEQIGQFT